MRSSPARSCPGALGREPRPLYSRSLDLALLWNAKAACTFAIKWLFYHEGVLDEAEAYAPWPHQYRQQVYCARPGYAQDLQRIPSLGARAIKVVRDPFDRAVGGYLSYCTQATKPMGRSPLSRFGGADRQHVPMLKAIGRFLGRTVGDGQLFTFREWVAFLQTLDLDTADIHVRRQHHPCEREGALPQLTIIRIEEASTSIPHAEDRLGLPRSDLARLRSSQHHTVRVDSSRFVGDEPFGQVLGSAIPSSPSFYDAELIDTVAALYPGDLQAYGYDLPIRDTSGPRQT